MQHAPRVHTAPLGARSSGAGSIGAGSPPVLGPIGISADEVLTGEAVALDVQPAGFLLRAVGGAIDALVSIGVLVVGLLLAFGPLLRVLGDDSARTLAIATVVLVTVALPVTVETASRGRSLGKLAVGARIVRADGGAAGFREALIRALIGLLELWFTLGALALVTSMFTPRAQRLGDLAAGCYSQRTRSVPLPRELPMLPPGLEGWAKQADVARLPDRTARRLAQFLADRAAIDPRSRERIAAELMRDVAPYVMPLPPAPPVVALTAVAAMRRDREATALAARAERLRRLAPVLKDAEGTTR